MLAVCRTNNKLARQFCNVECLVLHLGNNIGIVVMGLGVSAYLNLFINHVSSIQSPSCLPFFLYHPYMPLFLNSQALLPWAY